MAAPLTLPNRLQNLPADMLQELFPYLATGDLCALSTVCKDLHKSISTAQAREPAYAQRVLKAYLSPAPVSGLERQATLRQLDQNIRELEDRLRQIRVAPGRDRDPAEETSIERRLNFLRASRLPKDRFFQRIIDLVREYLDPPTNRTPINVIDTRQWNDFIGQVPHKPLLPGTETFLRHPCHIFPGKVIGETHVCIDIPPTVDGQPLTLNRILLFAEHNRGNRIHLNIYWNRILQELGDVPIPAGQYLLLKTCLPGTKSKTYQEQLEVLREYPEYMEATLPQVLVATLMEYIRSGGAETRLFEEEYARTSTTVDNWRLVFGGFGSGWPCVYYRLDDDSALGSVGLAVVLRSGGSSPVLGP